MSEFGVGQIVEHRGLPELGRAKVEASGSDHIQLLFERTGGGGVRTFRMPCEHLFLSSDQSGEGFDAVRAAKAGAKKKAAARGPRAQAKDFDAALKSFLARYPQGFEDPAFLKAERETRAKTVEAWRDRFTGDAYASLRQRGDAAELSKAFQEVFKTAPLFHPVWELAPFLKAVAAGGPAAFEVADAYAAAVAAGSFSADGFGRVAAAYAALGMAKPKWTVLTYWPYAASGRGFAFMKPKVTKAAAEGLGIAVKAGPEALWPAYEQIVSVWESLWQRLQPLGAQDWSDVQAFLWTGWEA